MFAHLAIGSALLATSLAALVVSPVVSTSDALITPGPNIELLRKQNNLQYIGWLEYSGYWSSETCDVGMHNAVRISHEIRPDHVIRKHILSSRPAMGVLLDNQGRLRQHAYWLCQRKYDLQCDGNRRKFAQ